MKIKETINTKIGDLWIMSDLHYAHENVIKFDKRPFTSVQKMNEYIESELVKKIKPTDTLIDLGDMFWKCDMKVINGVLDKISPRRFYKILGNHDKESVYAKNPKFDMVADRFEVGVRHNDKDYFLVLDHYPIISWNAKPRGAIMVHGHTHGNIDGFNNNSPDLRVDAGFYGELAKKTGSFILNFTDILKFVVEKAKTENLKKYTLDNCPEL